jgi:hypothetical protein
MPEPPLRLRYGVIGSCVIGSMHAASFNARAERMNVARGNGAGNAAHAPRR